MINNSQAPLDLIGGIANAIVTTSDTPLLLLSADLTILAASRSFCQHFALRKAVGLRLADLGDGEWDVPQLGGLLRATVTGPLAVEDYRMDLKLSDVAPRNLVVNAHRLEVEPGSAVMILLSVLDGTEERERHLRHEKLLRENAMMLAELQHRVANSLQIVASVLMQSARQLQSDEVREHLTDAHHRVMSIATLQQQLALSAQDDVEMRVYVANLCRSIGASMIKDRDRTRIEVDVDDIVLPARISLSLGLIVTELLINTLKHAFPDDRPGTIAVTLCMNAAGWQLSVADDGVGMPAADGDAKAGLGTSLIRALAHQIDAEISVVAGMPGTQVIVRHVGNADPARVPEMVPV